MTTYRGQLAPKTPAGQINEPQMKISRHLKPEKKLQIVLVSPKNFAFRTRSRRATIGRSLCVVIGWQFDRNGVNSEKRGSDTSYPPLEDIPTLTLYYKNVKLVFEKQSL